MAEKESDLRKLELSGYSLVKEFVDTVGSEDI